jgi:hypothetical protein
VTRKLRALPAIGLLTCLALAPCFARDAHADISAWRGRLTLGYGKLLFSGAPAGGFSMVAGVDAPIHPGFRLGPEVAYHLLGTSSVERGSANANIDYSLWEIGVQAHWLPEHAGILHRVSAGPALMGALADISASSAGLLFEDLTRSELAPGLTFDVAFSRPGPHVVTVGVEAGTRTAFLKSDTWNAVTLRLLLEY